MKYLIMQKNRLSFERFKSGLNFEVLLTKNIKNETNNKLCCLYMFIGNRF
jgi:hypothetical protein